VADDGFTAFFQGAYPRIVGQLRLLTGDLASAEDIAQEAFIRAASRWRQLARYDQPEAWVRRTAFRLAIDLLRRARRHRRLLARLGTPAEPDVELSPQDRTPGVPPTGSPTILSGGPGGGSLPGPRSPRRVAASAGPCGPPSQVRRVAAYSSMVWTGRDVLIASTQEVRIGTKTRTITVAGRYDPERARWTSIAPPRSGGTLLAWAGAAVVAPFENAVYDPATDGWLRLPALPEPVGRSPSHSWGAERALLRIEERTTGAIEVHVLVPARR